MHRSVSIDSELCSPSDILNPSIYILHLCILWHIAQLPQKSLERHHKVFPIEYHLHILGKGTLLSKRLHFLFIQLVRYKMMGIILDIFTKIIKKKSHFYLYLLRNIYRDQKTCTVDSQY